MFDYTYRPETFSNTAIISYSYFEMIYDLINGDIPIQPETIIGLSIFSEAIVLHEELVPNNIMLDTTSQDEFNFLQPFLDKKVLHYNYDKNYDIVLPLFNSAAECIINEMSEYNRFFFESEKFLFRWGEQADIEEQLNVFQYGFFDDDIDALYKYFTQWNNLVDKIGIPEICGIYDSKWGNINYNFYGLNRNINKSIPEDLLSFIDNKRFYYADKIRDYLGNTYVALPSIISIVLERSKYPEDIINQILLLREEMANFRNQCTKYEFELRSEENFLAQCEIVDEIINAYNCFNFDGKVRQKRRVLKECADIIASSPILALTNITKKGINCVDDILLKLKVPGYYDLYKKSFDVTDNLRTLKRLFGSAIDNGFLKRLYALTQQTLS